MPTLYVGNAQAKGSEPEDLFHVSELVKGTEAAEPVSGTGCKITWPEQRAARVPPQRRP